VTAGNEQRESMEVMRDIIFSSWEGQVVDNRGKEAQAFSTVENVQLPEFFKPDQKIRALAGWNGIVLRDPEVDVVDLVKAYLEAVHKVSSECNKCNYCTTGYAEMLDVLKDVYNGEATEEDLEFFENSGKAVIESSKCNIGKMGPTPALHLTRFFLDALKKKNQGDPGTGSGSYLSKVSAPCMEACPIHLDVPKYVEAIKNAKFDDALAVIQERLPLPGIVGRVCYHPCEQNCRRANADQPIAIRSLKRFAADQAAAKNQTPEFQITPSIKTGKVAVIGAGPAGLTCAFHLALKGHQVTIFEKQPLTGGMLALGIPDYRLSSPVREGEIKTITDLGVELRSGIGIGSDLTFGQLRAEGFQAFFLSIGAHECKTLGVEGEDLEGVYPGVDFLRDVKLGKKINLGERVAVIGGGNVAIDAVRTAKRLGAEKAFILYRRGREEMPAHSEEIADCLAEGIELQTLVNPTRIIGENGKVKAVECVEMTLGEADASGRRRPVPVEGSEFILEVDGVIAALGQESDWACLGPDCQCTLSDWGTVRVNPYTFQTDDPDIFAGGDAVTGPRSVIEAAANGRKAAQNMDRLINGLPLEPDQDDFFDDLFKVVRLYDPQEEVRVPEKLERLSVSKLTPDERNRNFDEVEQGYSTSEAVAEAERCLRCYRVVTLSV
jgi:NADPH-dependent glutamate synthase beta subunit-like oxidoreductase